MALSPQATVAAFAFAAAVPSLLANAFLLRTFLLNKKQLNSFWNRTILQLALQSTLICIVSLPTVLPALFNAAYSMPSGDNIGCNVQGFLVQWFNGAVWTIQLVMIVSMYRKVVHNINPERYERYTTAFIWGYPFLMACVPLLLSAPNFGPAGVWCWVHANHSTTRLALSYLFVWLSFIVLTVLEMRIWCFVRRALRTSVKSQHGAHTVASIKRNLFRTLSVYLIIYIGVWTPGSLARVLTAVAPAVLAKQGAIINGFLMFSLLSNGWLNVVAFAATNARTSVAAFRATCGCRRQASAAAQRRAALQAPSATDYHASHNSSSRGGANGASTASAQTHTSTAHTETELLPQLRSTETRNGVRVVEMHHVEVAVGPDK